MEEADRRKGILNLNKNSLLKLARQKEKRKMYDKADLQKLAQTWCTNIKVYALFEKLYKQVNSKLEQVMIKMAVVVIAQRMTRYLKFKLKVYGDTFDRRINQYTKFAIASCSTSSHDIHTMRAKKLMAQFMQKCTVVLQFKIETYEFLKQIYHISD